MVLFLFVIMLVNLDEAAKQRQFNRQWLVGMAAVALVAAELGLFLYRGIGTIHIADDVIAGIGTATSHNTEMIADGLFGEYLLPFEVASILLLVAVVGSVVMAKKRI
jgi:NADH-quinone oxidoreductase subunit J